MLDDRVVHGCCDEHLKSRVTTVFSILHWSERIEQVRKGFEDDGQYGYDSK